MQTQLNWTADLCAPVASTLPLGAPMSVVLTPATVTPIGGAAPRHNSNTIAVGTSFINADERHGYAAVKPAAPPRVPR